MHHSRLERGTGPSRVFYASLVDLANLLVATFGYSEFCDRETGGAASHWGLANNMAIPPQEA